MKKLLAVLFTVAALAGLTDMVGCKSEEPAAPAARKVEKPKTEKTTPADKAPTTKPATEKAAKPADTK
jgi:hypothetical protein